MQPESKALTLLCPPHTVVCFQFLIHARSYSWSTALYIHGLNITSNRNRQLCDTLSRIVTETGHRRSPPPTTIVNLSSTSLTEDEDVLAVVVEFNQLGKTDSPTKP